MSDEQTAEKQETANGAEEVKQPEFKLVEPPQASQTKEEAEEAEEAEEYEAEPVVVKRKKKKQQKDGKPKKSRTFITKKDVIIAALIEGGLEELIEKNKKKKIPVEVLRGAAEELEAKDRSDAASILFSLMEEWYPNSGRKGRAAPEEGETRVYSAQKLKENAVAWVRVPVNTLGLDARDKVSVKFESKRIVITSK